MSNYGSVSPPLKLTKAERDLLQADRPGYGSRTKFEVAFNLVNATVGAGIIGLPFALSHAGFVTGIGASIIVGLLAQLGLYMMVVAGQRVGIYKFALLVEYMMGRPGYHFLNFLICVQAGGGAVSYFILLGDSLPVLFERYLPQYTLLADRSFIIVFTGMTCIFPLCLSRSIGSLARWSILSVLCLPVILITILIRAPAYIPAEPVPLEWVGSDLFGALGIMAFAFTCHQVAFNNYLTLEDQSTSGWKITTTISTGMSWVISMTFAIIGYICFGKNVQSNLFMNFANDDPLINVGRFALSFSMILTIPVAMFPTREAIQKSLGFETATKQPSNTQHYAVTVFLFALIIAISISIRSLGIVYALVGGFSATTLANILPATAYFVTRRVYLKKHQEEEEDQHQQQKGGNYYPGNSMNNNMLFPTLTGSTTLTPDESDLKSPLLWETQSYSSSSRTTALFDDDVSTVDGDAYLNNVETQGFSTNSSLAPHWTLDIAAGLLIIWGFVVMFFSISSTLKGQ